MGEEGGEKSGGERGSGEINRGLENIRVGEGGGGRGAD